MSPEDKYNILKASVYQKAYTYYLNGIDANTTSEKKRLKAELDEAKTAAAKAGLKGIDAIVTEARKAAEEEKKKQGGRSL